MTIELADSFLQTITSFIAPGGPIRGVDFEDLVKLINLLGHNKISPIATSGHHRSVEVPDDVNWKDVYAFTVPIASLTNDFRFALYGTDVTYRVYQDGPNGPKEGDWGTGTYTITGGPSWHSFVEGTPDIVRQTQSEYQGEELARFWVQAKNRTPSTEGLIHGFLMKETDAPSVTTLIEGLDSFISVDSDAIGTDYVFDVWLVQRLIENFMDVLKRRRRGGCTVWPLDYPLMLGSSTSRADGPYQLPVSPLGKTAMMIVDSFVPQSGDLAIGAKRDKQATVWVGGLSPADNERFLSVDGSGSSGIDFSDRNGQLYMDNGESTALPVVMKGIPVTSGSVNSLYIGFQSDIASTPLRSDGNIKDEPAFITESQGINEGKFRIKIDPPPAASYPESLFWLLGRHQTGGGGVDTDYQYPDYLELDQAEVMPYGLHMAIGPKQGDEYQTDSDGKDDRVPVAQFEGFSLQTRDYCLKRTWERHSEHEWDIDVNLSRRPFDEGTSKSAFLGEHACVPVHSVGVYEEVEGDLFSRYLIHADQLPSASLLKSFIRAVTDYAVRPLGLWNPRLPGQTWQWFHGTEANVHGAASFPDDGHGFDRPFPEDIHRDGGNSAPVVKIGPYVIHEPDRWQEDTVDNDPTPGVVASNGTYSGDFDGNFTAAIGTREAFNKRRPLAWCPFALERDDVSSLEQPVKVTVGFQWLPMIFDDTVRVNKHRLSFIAVMCSDPKDPFGGSSLIAESEILTRDFVDLPNEYTRDKLRSINSTWDVAAAAQAGNSKGGLRHSSTQLFADPQEIIEDAYPFIKESVVIDFTDEFASMDYTVPVWIVLLRAYGAPHPIYDFKENTNEWTYDADKKVPVTGHSAIAIMGTAVYTQSLS